MKTEKLNYENTLMQTEQKTALIKLACSGLSYEFLLNAPSAKDLQEYAAALYEIQNISTGILADWQALYDQLEAPYRAEADEYKQAEKDFMAACLSEPGEETHTKRKE